jgi:hypothetical protein
MTYLSNFCPYMPPVNLKCVEQQNNITDCVILYVMALVTSTAERSLANQSYVPEEFNDWKNCDRQDQDHMRDCS